MSAILEVRDRGDDFDRVEIMGRLRVVEQGKRTKLERKLQREIRLSRRFMALRTLDGEQTELEVYEEWAASGAARDFEEDR